MSQNKNENDKSEKDKLTYEKYKTQLKEEIFSLDQTADYNYKNFHNSVNKSYKYAILYTSCIMFGFYYYARNVSYFKNKFGMNKKTLGRILLSTFMHLTIPILILIPNFYIIYGRHPWRYFKQKKKMEDELMEGENFLLSLNQLTDFVEKEVKAPSKKLLNMINNIFK